MFVELPFNRFDINLVLSIIHFTENNTEGLGYVVKFPFVTNSEGIRYPKSYVQVSLSLSLLTLSVYFIPVSNELYLTITCLRYLTSRKSNSLFSFLKVFQDLLNASIKFENRIPYAIIQPCLANRMEYKLILHKGIHLCISNNLSYHLLKNSLYIFRTLSSFVKESCELRQEKSVLSWTTYKVRSTCGRIFEETSLCA